MPTLKEMLHATSRTFALGIERLPGVLGNSVMIAYLLLRVSDYLEDNEKMPPEQKAALLDLWSSILVNEEHISRLTAQIGEPDLSNPDAVVAVHASEVLQALYALPAGIQTPIIQNVRDTTRGMARWVMRGPRVENEYDMDDYMHEVAGRVGYLLTQLFSCYSSYIRQQKNVLMPLAREFGLALQTVNVIRGLREDFERGWIFVPSNFCAPLNIRREDLFQAEHISEALQVLDKLTEKADRHLLGAMSYLKSLPPWQYGIRLFCVYPLMFAVRTLAISRHNQAVLQGEVKITRDEVARIVRDTTLWCWSNRWLDRYYQNLGTITR